jgi:hypothetical protein
LRSSKEAAAYPDVMTFAFWCRKANIAMFKAAFEDGKARLGRGVAFHITPSNVPTNFAYSFVFGLLAGNANIVRVPSRSIAQVDVILACIKRLFDHGRHGEIRVLTAFVRYRQDDRVTGIFSAGCDARLIWGGDTSVRKIRSIPIPERSVELVFPDRYSFCVMDAPSVVKLGEAGLGRLAGDFYNDTYLMDQNACSSPHLVVWQGSQKEEAKERFWKAVHKLASERYELKDISAIEKYALLCRDAVELDNISGVRMESSRLCRVAVKSLPDNTDGLRGRCGYFYEYDTDDINSMARIINAKYQTLTYFGVDKSYLGDFVLRNRCLGIDRIVPVGSALAIGPIWDGYDIVKSLSRIIDVR